MSYKRCVYNAVSATGAVSQDYDTFDSARHSQLIGNALVVERIVIPEFIPGLKARPLLANISINPEINATENGMMLVQALSAVIDAVNNGTL